MDTYVAGTTRSVSADIGIPGQAANLTVKVVNPATDVVVYGPSGAGIDEDDAGIYDIESFPVPSATAPAYRLLWLLNGAVVWTETFAVTSSGEVGSVAPSGSDLTTLARSKNWLAITDTTQDARLQQLITAASHAVMEYAQREFAPSSSGVTRQFALKRDGLVTFGKYDLQTATSVQIDTESGGSPTTLTTDQYQLLPIDEPHGVYRSLRFYTFAIGPVLRQAFGLYRHVGITGTWGFPSVPADVEQATLVTVAKWFKRDEVAWSNEMPAPSFSDGLNLPFDARMLVQPYKRGA